MKTSILYYSSNREKPDFEERIVADLLTKTGDLPIVSVTQKPLNLGHNICVGDRGLSYVNEYRQILIGLQAITTPYFIAAESDFIYPPEYFNFEPGNDPIYRCDNVWVVLKPQHLSFRRKPYSEGAQICNREFMIEALTKYLSGLPEWMDGPLPTNHINNQKIIFMRRLPFSYFHCAYAALTFKTGNGVRPNTAVFPDKINRKQRLPYWGHVEEIRRRFYGTES